MHNTKTTHPHRNTISSKLRILSFFFQHGNIFLSTKMYTLKKIQKYANVCINDINRKISTSPELCLKDFFGNVCKGVSGIFFPNSFHYF